MKKGFVLITLILILVTAFCTTGTVMGMEKDKLSVDETFFEEMERDYVYKVRQYLDAEGYCNSGVVLTKVTFEDGSREYTLNIHHRRFDKLEKNKQDELKSMLADMVDFSGQTTTVVGEILVVFS